jgi:hypothetical protein
VKYVPLISGRPPGATRPLGCPSLVSPIPANAAVWFEDFYAATIAKKAFEVGTIATPDTGTHVSALGHPSWIATETAGTLGLVGCTSGSNSAGNLTLTTGTTSGNTLVVDAGGRTAANMDSGGTLNATLSTAGRVNVCFRLITPATITNLNFGVGLPQSSVNYGTDWLTDPDTTLLGATTSGNSIVITRHAAAYSGDTAGALVLRLYEAGGTDDTSLELSASIATSTAYKVELSFTNGAIAAYLNGTLVGTLSTPNVALVSARPSFIAQTTTGAARAITIDSYYQEVGQTTAR